MLMTLWLIVSTPSFWSGASIRARKTMIRWWSRRGEYAKGCEDVFVDGSDFIAAHRSVESVVLNNSIVELYLGKGKVLTHAVRQLFLFM
eukprot:8987248-Ditylum_brightwellii.AAC.1